MTLELANSMMLGFLAALALLLCGWGLATRSTSRSAWPLIGLGISFSFYAATPFVYEARQELGPLFALTLFGESFVPVVFCQVVPAWGHCRWRCGGP
jgi:hypothetical protein